MRRAAVPLLLALGLAACAPEEGIDLRLVADPNVNPEAQVVAALDSIVLVVDADEGLYRPGEERVGAGVQIENADGDAALELVATVPARPDRLPVIRLARGSLPDVSLELRLLGIRSPGGGMASAVGLVRGVRLSSPPEEIAVSFNLRPELLPPRVTEILPGDGAMIPGCEVTSILVMFSAAIDEASLLDGVRVSPGEITEVRVDPSGRTAQLAVVGVGGDGSSVGYRLTLDETVVDREGRPIDQVPGEEGAQPYVADVEVVCSRGMATPDNPCATADPGMPGTCPFPERLECVGERCVPRSCSPAACEAQTVCDPASGHCELDCRLWGEASICPEERAVCDAERGVCVPVPE